MNQTAAQSPRAADAGGPSFPSADSVRPGNPVDSVEASVCATDEMCREWGWIALRGALAIVFGVMALAWPLATIWALAVLWGAFAFLDGIGAGISGWRMHKRGLTFWPYIILAVTGIAAGVVTLLWPGITALALMMVIGIWAVFLGISQIVAAVRMRKEIEGEWLLAFAGAVSVLFGLLLLFRPLPEGILAVAWIVAFYAFVTGTLYIMLALRLRKRTQS